MHITRYGDRRRKPKTYYYNGFELKTINRFRSGKRDYRVAIVRVDRITNKIKRHLHGGCLLYKHTSEE